MNTALDLARWQFGITTVYHFLFVPITIGITWFVAWFQTRWMRTGDPDYLRLTRFFGKLMLINFAIGVVTGIVQEFQFGMNWSDYSRYVGDIFGAPLAMEALAAFFLESTFLGLWIFGWGRLSPKVHLATIYAVAIGTTLSAYFILAANAFMQHPVGYMLNAKAGRAEMTSIVSVLTNPVSLLAFPHTILAAFASAGIIVAGVAAWHIHRRSDAQMFMHALRLGVPVVFIATMATMLVGHAQAQLMVQDQPMKMAAAEALYETTDKAPFSLFAVAPFEKRPDRTNFNLTVPYGLSILATNNPNGTVKGINDLQAEYEQKYGPGDYTPILGVTYWSFRLMVGAGMLLALVTFIGSILLWRRSIEDHRWILRLLPFAIVLPFIANSTGWIFTEMGRQPWIVQGLLKTTSGVSPGVSATEVAITLIGFTALYGALAVVDCYLMFRYARSKPAPSPAKSPDDAVSPRDIAMAY